jgi:glycosyltransferase involved in cell wall biosynthesis
MKVVHVISGLISGGSGNTLWRLLGAARFEAEVVSLTGLGETAMRIRRLGIPVVSLGMGGIVSNTTAIARLALWLRQRRPDIVQTWQYHADLVGGLAARLGTDVPLLWNIRHSEFVPGMDKRATLWTVRACAALSRRVPTKIVCCSHASRSSHARLGYPLDSMVVVPNGFDLAAFRPDAAARAATRRELGVSKDDVLIGVIANHRPEKDFANFFAAAAQLYADRPRVRFLISGFRIDWDNEAIAHPIRELGLAGRFSLLGNRSDVARIHAALDIGCSSSISEGMPNAIGEAMACAVPCVVTDVGDCSKLVGETGLVVPARDSAALASALRDLVDAGPARRRELGAFARLRIAAHFGFRAFVEHYHRIYEEVCDERRGKGFGRAVSA